MSKQKAIIKHARSRAAERFGICLGPSSHREIINQIQNGEGKFIKKQSNRVTVWEVKWDDKLVKVVYDKMRHLVITFLPE